LRYYGCWLEELDEDEKKKELEIKNFIKKVNE